MHERALALTLHWDPLAASVFTPICLADHASANILLTWRIEVLSGMGQLEWGTHWQYDSRDVVSVDSVEGLEIPIDSGHWHGVGKE